MAAHRSSGTTGAVKDRHAQLFETESPYNYVEVRRVGNCNHLYLNEGAVLHSMYCDDGEIPWHGVHTVMLAAPYFNPPGLVHTTGQPIENLAVIGLGAGAVPKRFTKVFGAISDRWH